MSETLHIRFAEDMPEAAVEVVGPDLTTIDQVWLRPGTGRSVPVPSEAAFLRIHLTSGEIVTLEDPGNLDRVIEKASLTAHLKAPLPVGEVDWLHAAKRRSLRGFLAPRLEVHLPGPLQVSLEEPRSRATGEVDKTTAGAVFRPDSLWSESYLLTLDTPGLRVRISLPGMIEELTIQSSMNNAPDKLAVTVRVRTESSTADAIGAYMARGDLHSVAVMTEWAERAEGLLEQKIGSPFAAAVGAYLLLRLRRFDLLHRWARNLADWFPDISDGAVIWASQLIQMQQRDARDSIREYLLRAARGPLPIFSEGLQLLGDGLRLLGPEAAEAIDNLNKRSGLVVWRSPFTATVHHIGEGRSAGIDLDVGYASRL